jgi:hypothetical protein
MKAIYSALVLMLLAVSGNCASWEKLFSARSADVFRCVREVPAGGYVCAGYTSDSTANDSDAWIVRLNVSGDTIWTYKYNGPTSRKDLFYKVAPTSDGGFICCGWTTGNAQSDDFLILKLNSSGVKQWSKSYGGSGRERAQDIIQTSDDNYIMCGYTTSSPATYYDAVLYRLNTVGDTIWTRRYGGGIGSYDDANSVKQITNGYIMGGQSTNGSNDLDQYLIRTDSSGNIIWSNKFGTPNTDNIECVTVLSDGYILAGGTHDTTTMDNGYLVRTDTSGTPVWSYSYGGASPDDFHRVEITPDGNFIASGTTSSTGPLNPNMWLVKISNTGTLMWQKAYGGDNHDHGYSAEPTSDGGYIIAGHTGSYGYNYEEAYVVKVDGNGDITPSANKLVYTTVVDLISPTAATCGSANTPVTVIIRNFSNAPITTIPVTVQVTGSQNQTFNQTYPASEDTVTLGTLNTAAGGTFTFTCFTNNGNDVVPARNGITRTITIPAFNAPPTVTGDNRCGPGSVSLSATSAGTIYWFTAASGGTSVATGTTYSTPSINTTTTYYVQTGNGACPSTRVAVVATINTIPPVPTFNGAGNCGPGTVTMTVGSSGTVSWFTASSGGSPIATGLTYVTPSLSTTTTYYVEADNGNCTSNRIPVVAQISSVAADPLTTNGSHCGPGSVVLNATSPDPIRWYDAASGGTQVGSQPTLITPFISTTTTFYAQADNGCVSNRVLAIATINPKPNDPVVTEGHTCGIGNVTLSATSSNSLNWYDAPTGGNQIGSNTTYVTPMLSNTTTYYVEAFDGTCPSNRIPVIATYFDEPYVYLGNDTAFGFGANYTIDAGAGFNTYTWSTGETTQTINVTSTDTFCVTVTDSNTCAAIDCILVDFSIGIQKNELTGVSIYPNPANGIFKIELQEQDAVLTVRNLSGQIIKMQDLPDPINTIDLGANASGFYFLTINSKNGILNSRITVE